jgi:hypothetical protein
MSSVKHSLNIGNRTQNISISDWDRSSSENCYNITDSSYIT